MTATGKPSSAARGERLLALIQAQPAGSLAQLVEIMRVLRSGEGCPWDREQTLQTLKQHLIEESYEVIDAIDSGDRQSLKDELGDLLLQAVFQAQICAEEGAFSFSDVVRNLCDKLLRRHQHVFGEVQAATAEEALKSWDSIKRTEQEGVPASAIHGIPRHLPALHRAAKVQKKAARVGFDWKNVHDVLAKIEEEVAETRQAIAGGQTGAIREEIGDLLFAVTNLSRFLGHNAEDALDETIAKFTRRFQAIERQVHGQGKKMTDCSLEELDAIWDEVKSRE